MRAQGTVFMSRTRPVADTSADGKFRLVLLAMDRIDSHRVEPWRITWTGEEARAFWAEHASLTDGLRNTQAMLAAKCPPALHIAKLATAEGHTDLYLPSRAELWALRANVPELFDKTWHWSSTQDSASSAFAQLFEYGSSYWSSKGIGFRVRAVRRIPLQHFPT